MHPLAPPYIRPISCRIAVANADLAEHGYSYVTPLVIYTVAVAVIYCIGSLPNGAAGEERRGKEKAMRMEEDKEAHIRGY